MEHSILKTIRLKHIKFLIVLSLVLGLSQQSYAGSSESCNCTIDTLGYSNFVQTLTVADVPIQFHVHGTFAVAIGYITSSTPTVVQNLIDNNPNVTTIVLLNSGGSEDDQANLTASQLIHNAGYKMYIPSNGSIASGAVDMFIAGTIRVADVGSQVGVHSWSDGTNDATNFPIGHNYHLPYINYYISMGYTQQASEDFYYFTINAAPASSIYWMTEAEKDLYSIRTCTFSLTPTYSASILGNLLSADLINATYQWLDCDAGNAPIVGATSQVFSPEQNGNYSVIVSENGGCTDTTICYTYSSASLHDSPSFSSVNVYPNPGSNNISLDLTSTESPTEVTLLEISGKIISKHVYPNSEKVVLDHPKKSGIYFIVLKSNNTFKTIKYIQN